MEMNETDQMTTNQKLMKETNFEALKIKRRQIGSTFDNKSGNNCLYSPDKETELTGISNCADTKWFGR
jgi:hypothetical protein